MEALAMNPQEIYEYIATLSRQGPEFLATAVIAVVVGLFLGWKFRSWRLAKDIEAAKKEQGDAINKLVHEKDETARLNRELSISLSHVADLRKDNESAKKELDEAKEKVHDLNDKLAKIDAELVTLRADFKVELQKEVTNRTAPLQVELDTAKKEATSLMKLATRYRSERNESRKKRDELQGELEPIKQKAEELQKRLTTTEERLKSRIEQHEKAVRLLLEERQRREGAEIRGVPTSLTSEGVHLS
jgi:DNA repair exonuclease SbcCD ATPase subunit